jgi:hypothetical protein
MVTVEASAAATLVTLIDLLPSKSPAQVHLVSGFM